MLVDPCSDWKLTVACDVQPINVLVAPASDHDEIPATICAVSLTPAAAAQVVTA